MAAVPSAFLPAAAPWAGVVEFVEAGGRRLRVRPEASSQLPAVTARWVAVPGWTPAPGDGVLVLGDTAGGCFVAGPLADSVPAPVRRMELPGGGEAELDAAAGTLQVRDAGGGVLFSYRCAEGTGTLRLEADEVELAATRGDLRLCAAGRVEARGRQVDLSGAAAVSVSVGQGTGAGGSRLELERGATRLDTGTLEVQAGRAGGRVERADWAGGSWSLGVERLVLNARRLESRAEVLVETVGSAYRKARELSQQSARRMRHLVEDSIQVRSRRILQRATEAFKVRGDKIHLG